MRKHLIRTLGLITIIAMLLVIAVYSITETDWGHEQVRRRLQVALQNNTHGILRIGRISGNLLKGFTLHDVSVTDSAGALLVKADSVTTSYGLNNLRNKHIEFDDLTLFHPTVIFDRKPGERWNWDRIFPRDTVTPAGLRKTGWGTWVRFTNLTIIDGDLTVRSPWTIDEKKFKGAAAAAALKQALSDQGRYNLVKVPGG